ncbi:putative cytochrome-b5 reductase [Lupinus albus]|uniref:Putative cytochrome-b5 reductase n=1 Tax=Lupinus albus TaxID=3870 RepID=A0A6A4PCB0_LUPAL|nr:putative cytochrome-b5 reductase [Lupinus albus]
MDFLHTPEIQIFVGVAVAVVAVGVGAFYLYSSKKPKGLFFFNFITCPDKKVHCFCFFFCIKDDITNEFVLALQVTEDPKELFFIFIF